MSDAGSERGGRRGYEPSDGKVRDFSNWERRGPLPPAPGQAQTLRDGGRQISRSKDGPANFRRNSPGWGEGRSQDGSRPPRREYTEKPPVERQPTAPELDNEWRARMKPDAPAKSPTPETSNPPSPRPTAAVAAAPVTRPKLNLQKRTVSEAVAPATSPSAGGESKASPFGAARPVDTATKERELEEKRLLAIRQKKEVDDKAKAEKAEEKRLAKDKAESEKVTPASPRNAKEGAESKEDGEEAPQTTPKFDILRRADSATNDMIAEDEQDEEPEAPAPTDDKAVKPKEVVVDGPVGQTNGGSWRNKSQKQAETTAETMEEDGWSTVSKPTKQRNNRRNNMPTRALAS
jgi:translation initiation factor 4B